jgi:hypothetical protein
MRILHNEESDILRCLHNEESGILRCRTARLVLV